MTAVALVSKDLVLANTVEKILKNSYQVVLFSAIQSSLNYIYSSMPDLIIIDTGVEDGITLKVVNDLKNDPTFGQIPVVTIFDDNVTAPKWEKLFVDDYIRKSSLHAELHGRLELCLKRSARIVDINPLTRIPGNIAIMKQIQNRLDAKETFAVAWVDLDHFKPFNDRYGFARGDEVLKMVGRLVLNTVKEEQPEGSFVGHIGGDDFVYIVGYDQLGTISDKIIENFDRIIPIFYDEEDRLQGFIESMDRQGNMRKFSIMSISIGISHNKFGDFSLSFEIAEIASEMKKYAKQTAGSCYKVDRRQAKRY